MSEGKNDQVSLERLVEQLKGAGASHGKNFRLSSSTTSPDGKRKVDRVGFLAGDVWCTALFVDEKLIYWAGGISNLVFSPDGKRFAFTVCSVDDLGLLPDRLWVRTSEGEAFRNIPGGSPKEISFTSTGKLVINGRQVEE